MLAKSPPPQEPPSPKLGLWGSKGVSCTHAWRSQMCRGLQEGVLSAAHKHVSSWGWPRWHDARRHPDKNTSVEAEGGAKFQRISAAYQHLINPPKPKRKIIVNMGGHDVCVGEVGSWLQGLHPRDQGVQGHSDCPSLRPIP